MARALAAGFNDFASSRPDGEVLSGHAEAAGEGVLLVLEVKFRDPAEFGSYVEAERLSWEADLCSGGPRDYLNAGVWFSVTYQPAGGIDSTGNAISLSNYIGKDICEARDTAARQAFDELRRAQDQQAAAYEARAAAAREAAAAQAIAERRAAEAREAQARLATEQRQEAGTWHAIMTPDRFRAWMAIEEGRRGLRRGEGIQNLHTSMLALVSAEIADDAELRSIALRWIAEDRSTNLPDLDERKFLPTKDDAAVRADVRTILQTTEVVDDRIVSRVESALAEEVDLWRRQRRDALCAGDGLVDAAGEYVEHRYEVVKRALAVIDRCGRHDVERDVAILKRMAAAIPAEEVVDFWQRANDELRWSLRDDFQLAVGQELSSARASADRRTASPSR